MKIGRHFVSPPIFRVLFSEQIFDLEKPISIEIWYGYCSEKCLERLLAPIVKNARRSYAGAGASCIIQHGVAILDTGYE